MFAVVIIIIMSDDGEHEVADDGAKNDEDCEENMLATDARRRDMKKYCRYRTITTWQRFIFVEISKGKYKERKRESNRMSDEGIIS
ncbi:hypothetical protein ElyMa_001318100 [Elysia marginata]|uniref:Uncharacterized protein n=1 Tax=Elysia marginata TaxID=1093978 RepID=A0AAV4IKE7_9GAST|nr:hypothetical protein ElyMa_001318100 [Elysia marginata]